MYLAGSPIHRFNCFNISAPLIINATYSVIIEQDVKNDNVVLVTCSNLRINDSAAGLGRKSTLFLLYFGKYSDRDRLTVTQ